MDRWQNRVAVVTGASSGIGAAVAKDLVESGLIVVALARRVDNVEEIRKSLTSDQQNRFYPKKCDVSKEDDVTATFQWIESTLGGTDILVNNAGCSITGQLTTMKTSDIQTVLNTNVMGIVYCTQAAFKSMKARNFDGHVVLINSVLGRIIPGPIMGADVPGYNIYPATKFAVTAMTEVYRQEFSGLGTKVKITSVSPGLTMTELVPEQFIDYFAGKILKSEDISSAVLYAISTPPHVQIHEITVKPIGEDF